LQDRGEADQHHEQSKKLRKPAIRGKSIDSPKANCSDNDDYQNADKGRNHVRFPSLFALTISAISTSRRTASGRV
jgi:hypothetical protein